MNIALLLTSFTIIINIILGILVYLKNPKNRINSAFFLVIILISGWAFCLYASNHTNNYLEALWWNKLIYAVTSIMMVYISYFSIVFPRENPVLNSKTRILWFLPGIILAILVLSTKLLVENIYYISSGTAITFGPLFILHSLFIIFYLGFTLINLAIKYLKSNRRYKMQIGYFFFGSFLSGFFAIITNVFLPSFGNFQLTKFGPSFTLIFVALTTYAIVKYNLMDIRIVINRIVAMPDRFLFRNKYLYQETIKELGKRSNSIVDSKELLSLFCGRIKERTMAKNVNIYFIE